MQICKALLARRANTRPETLRTVKTALGIDVKEVTDGRKPYPFGCSDWTEQEPYLGGHLGALRRKLKRCSTIDALERADALWRRLRPGL